MLNKNIRITPLGGAFEIGANSYLLETGDFRLLLDSGMHPQKIGYEALPEMSLIKKDLDAVFISHGHFDHIGSLPLMLKKYPRMRIYMHKITRKISLRMLHNTVNVMKLQERELGIDEYPLYSHEDVDELDNAIFPMEYNEMVDIGWKDNNIKITMFNSGHVLGAASVYIDYDGYGMIYTGDISVSDQEILTGMSMPDLKVNTLIIESTYGNDPQYDNKNRKSELERLAESINKIIMNKGSILIPAFALGKTQDMLGILYRLKRDKVIKDVPVYMTGLGCAITEIYDNYGDYLQKETGMVLRSVASVPKRINRETVKKMIKKSCIIVATSGMMVEKTPSAIFAEEMIQHEEHGIFFVGYVAPELLGARVIKCQKGDEIQFDRSSPVKIRVVNENINYFYLSAHANRKDIIDVVDRFSPRKVLLVHGERSAVEWLEKNLGHRYDVITPENGNSVEL